MTEIVRSLESTRGRPLSLLLGALTLLTACGNPAPAPDAYALIDHVSEAERDFDEQHLRSIRGDARLVSQVTLQQDTRQALIPPVPSRLSFNVDLPAKAIMRFSNAVSTLGAEVQAAHVDFRVLLSDESGETAVFEGSVLRRQPNQWLDREVDLSRWSGSRVRLTLETRARTGDGGETLPILPYWANPVVVSGEPLPSTRPNLILISLDCLRADHLGSYGYERDTTPRLDQLASRSTVFETAISASSFTHPTHMTMLTGLPPSIHGVSRWQKPGSSLDYLPDLLSTAGYRTSGIVSGPLLSQSFGFERGFDRYHWFHDTTRANALAEAALQMLERGRGQPQFLFLHFFDIHWPYWPPDEFNTMFGSRAEDASRLLGKVRHQYPPDSDEDIRHVIDLYDGELAYLDREVGRFIDALQDRGLYDNTLIIVTADHGEAFFEHGFWEHGQTLYEEMVHVPLIVKWPAMDRAERIGALVSQSDIFPTLLEAAGLEPRGEGLALSRYLSDPSPEPRKVISEITWDPLPTRPAYMDVAWRGERYKYIAHFQAPTVDALYTSEIQHDELYDLKDDPEEKRNVLQEVRAEARSGRRAVLDYLARARALRALRGGEDVTLDDELLERLRALGYIDQ